MAIGWDDILVGAVGAILSVSGSATLGDSQSKMNDNIVDLLSTVERLVEKINLLHAAIEKLPKDLEKVIIKVHMAKVQAYIRIITDLVTDITQRPLLGNGHLNITADEENRLNQLINSLELEEEILVQAWQYTSYRLVVVSCLVRMNVCAILYKTESYKLIAYRHFYSAKRHRLHWMRAGIDQYAPNGGPARTLQALANKHAHEDDIFNKLEANWPFAIGWIPFIGGPTGIKVPTTVEKADSHIKISQPTLAGTRVSGFNAPEGPVWDSEPIAGISPVWAHIVIIPGAEPGVLYPAFTGYIKDIAFDSRGGTMQAIDKLRMTFGQDKSDIEVLKLVIEDLNNSILRFEELKIAPEVLDPVLYNLDLHA